LSDGQVLAAQLADVTGGLPRGVDDVPGQRLDLGGEVGDGAARGGGQGQGRVEHGADAGLVEVDAAGADGANLSWQRQLVEMPSGKKPVSAQSRAVANRSAMSASRAAIWPKWSRPRRQRSSRVLCTVASKRRTCSPLV